MNKSSKVVGELEELLSKYEKLFIENVNPSRNNNEIFLCGYFLTATEYVEGICILVKNDNLISIEPLFRSLLETVVDITNLCNHQDYHLYLRREQLKKAKKRYEKWNEDKQNEFFPDIDNIDDAFRNSVKVVKKEIKELNEMKFSFTKSKSLETWEKFDLADLKKVHRSIWDLVSSAIHNDLSNIRKRHIIEKENGEIIITRKGKFELNDVTAHLITIPGLLFSAIGEIFEKYELNKEEIEMIYKKGNERIKNILEYEEN